VDLAPYASTPGYCVCLCGGVFDSPQPISNCPWAGGGGDTRVTLHASCPVLGGDQGRELLSVLPESPVRDTGDPRLDKCRPLRLKITHSRSCSEEKACGLLDSPQP
jgi:hypothetical protein